MESRVNHGLRDHPTPVHHPPARGLLAQRVGLALDGLDALQRGGELFVSNAVVGGRYLLRACIVNFHTTRADVEAVPEIVARTGRAIDAEMRPAV